jgi:2-keto-4-pentenoate hydratase
MTVIDERILRGMTSQFRLRQRRLVAGDEPIGWKIGFGSPAALEKMAIQAPLVGFLLDRALVPSGTIFAISDFKKPAVEPEIAVHMGADLPAGASRQTARQAIAAIGPAIEIADAVFPPDHVEEILAGNIYQRNLVLGDADSSRAGGVLDGLRARVLRQGKEVANTTNVQAITGELIDNVRHVADLLTEFGEILRAGQIIITGSIVPPIRLTQPEEIEFALEPIGTISVGFSGA